MNGILMNRSKMLIRRASTRENLLRQRHEIEREQLSPEFTSENNLLQKPEHSQTVNASSKGRSDTVRWKGRRLKKSASSGVVLREIRENNVSSKTSEDIPLSTNLNESGHNLNQAEGHQGSERQTEFGNCRSRVYDPLAVNALRMTGSSFGLTLGFTIPSSVEDQSQAQRQRTHSDHSSKQYQRSQSCGIIVSLNYLLKHPDTGRNEREGSEGINSSTTTVLATTSLGMNYVNTNQDLERSRSLLALSGRDHDVMNGNMVQEGTVKEVDDNMKANTHSGDEEADEGEADIGRFTKLFREALDENVENLDNRQTINSPHDNNNTSVGVPYIKPLLLPPRGKSGGIDVKKQSNVNKQTSKLVAEVSEFHNIEEEDRSASTKLSTATTTCRQAPCNKTDGPGNPSHGEESSQLPIGQAGSSHVKVRRQGSVDRPDFSANQSMLNSEDMPKGGCKTKLSKKAKHIEKTLKQLPSPVTNRHTNSNNFQSALQTPSFTGFRKAILPPIQHVTLAHEAKHLDSLRPLETSVGSSWPPYRTMENLLTAQSRSGNDVTQERHQIQKPQQAYTSSDMNISRVNRAEVNESDTNNSIMNGAQSTLLSGPEKIESLAGLPRSGDNQFQVSTGNLNASSSLEQRPNISSRDHSVLRTIPLASVTSLPDSNGNTLLEDSEEFRSPRAPSASWPQSRSRLDGHGTDVRYSPELFLFLRSPCAIRRGAVCQVIEEAQGRPLEKLSGLAKLQKKMG